MLNNLLHPPRGGIFFLFKLEGCALKVGGVLLRERREREGKRRGREGKGRGGERKGREERGGEREGRGKREGKGPTPQNKNPGAATSRAVCITLLF